MTRRLFLIAPAVLAPQLTAEQLYPIRAAEYSFDPVNPGVLLWRGRPVAFIGQVDDKTKAAEVHIRNELLNNLNT